MAQTVIGFFEDAQAAQRAAQQLEDDGFSRHDIDISRSNNTGNSQVAADRDQDHENGVTRFFKSLFGDNDEAERYSRVGNSGCSIVTVHARTAEEAERAADLLDDYGAIDVNERAGNNSYTNTSGMADTSSRNYSDSRYNTTLDDRRPVSDDLSERSQWNEPRTGENRMDVNRQQESIPRIQENLEVGKRTVETGGVRIRSRIVERPVEENIRLREERVKVERNPADRPVSDTEMANFQEREIELTERAEVPVVNKEARVVEEVRVSKEVNERTETVRDSVRKTEIDVENINRKENRDDLDLDDDNRRNPRNNDPIFGS